MAEIKNIQAVLETFLKKDVQLRVRTDESVTNQQGMYAGPILVQGELVDVFRDESTRDLYIVIGRLPKHIEDGMKKVGADLPVRNLINYTKDVLYTIELAPHVVQADLFAKEVPLKKLNKVKVLKVSRNAVIPTKSYDNALGYDLYASVEIDIPGEGRKLIPTGIALAFPSNFGGVIKDTSGVASNLGLFVEAGVIDPDYRGEIKVLLFNSNIEPSRIMPDAGLALSQKLIRETDSSFADRILRLEVLLETHNADFKPLWPTFSTTPPPTKSWIYELATWKKDKVSAGDALTWLRSLPSNIQTNQPTTILIAECPRFDEEWNEVQDWLGHNIGRDGIHAPAFILQPGLREQSLMDASQSRVAAGAKSANGQRQSLTMLLTSVASGTGSAKARICSGRLSIGFPRRNGPRGRSRKPC